MATILLIHCNRLTSGVQYPGISSMSAFAKKAGHKFILFDTANYASGRASESPYGHYGGGKSLTENEKLHIALDFKHIKNRNAMPVKKPFESLLNDLENEVLRHKIDIVGFSSFSDDWPFTLFLIGKVHAILPNVPIIVGGVHASLAPEEVIKHPDVTMVCIGEGEMPLVELLNSIDKGAIDLTVKNLWIKYENQIFRNPIRPLLQFTDDLPILDWSLYNDIQLLYPFEGRFFRRGSIFIGRGCPYSCRYCINDFFKHTYAKNERHIRFKSLTFIIGEIAYLKNEYNLEFLRFWDETFLCMPKKYLSEFAKVYKREIGLPFTIETGAQTINHENARMLAEMGCQSVSIGVETSNEDLRMKILKKTVTNEAYDRCFGILTEYGLRKVANFMFFLPHQTLADMWRDVYLCKKWRIDHPSARIFYPYLGTGLREYCLKNDMIDLDILKRIEDEESIRDIDSLNESYITFQDTVLKVDAKMKQDGKLLLDNFILFQETEPSMHGEIKYLLTKNDTHADNVLRKIEREIYKRRFGEEPLLQN